MDLTFVMYSHTEFLDMLEIASDYASNIKNKVLLINKTNENIDFILSKFDKVIYYDDNLSYTDKVAETVSKINTKYILFTHEIDIVLNMDVNVIEKLCQFMELTNVDRIDLQPNGGNDKGIYYKIDGDVDKWGFYEDIKDPNMDLDLNYDYLGLHSNWDIRI
jgi:translation elongation factor EF-1beta